MSSKNKNYFYFTSLSQLKLSCKERYTAAANSPEELQRLMQKDDMLYTSGVTCWQWIFAKGPIWRLDVHG